MNPETHLLRLPNKLYNGRNGFKQDFTDPSQIQDPYRKQVALEAHRRAMFILNNKKRVIPSFDKMEPDLDDSNILTHNSDAIQSVKDDHLLDLQKLYEYQADEYHQEILDKYVFNDESWYEPENTGKSTKRLQELLYNGFTKDYLLKAQWQGDYEQLSHTYLSQLLALQSEQVELRKKQEEERRRWEKAFPLSKEDFNKKGRDVQLRVARFLIATEHEKEKMLSIYNWAWRQVMPLQELFKTDARFAADIRGLVMADNAVSDPRRARMQ